MRIIKFRRKVVYLNLQVLKGVRIGTPRFQPTFHMYSFIVLSVHIVWCLP